MLKKRIIATVIVKNGIVVQSKCFENYLPVGKIDVSLILRDMKMYCTTIQLHFVTFS